MADLIQIKRGDTTGTSFLSDGELGYSREEKALYIGVGGKRNLKLCSAETAAEVEENATEIEKIATELPEKLTATAIPAMDALSAESDLTAVIAAVNSLISAMKVSGIMK